MQLYKLAVVLGLLAGNAVAAPTNKIIERTAPELILPDAGLTESSKYRRTAPEVILPNAGLTTESKERRTAPELILPDAGLTTGSSD